MRGQIIGCAVHGGSFETCANRKELDVFVLCSFALRKRCVFYSTTPPVSAFRFRICFCDDIPLLSANVHSTDCSVLRSTWQRQKTKNRSMYLQPLWSHYLGRGRRCCVKKSLLYGSPGFTNELHSFGMPVDDAFVDAACSVVRRMQGQ